MMSFLEFLIKNDSEVQLEHLKDRPSCSNHLLHYDLTQNNRDQTSYLGLSSHHNVHFDNLTPHLQLHIQVKRFCYLMH